MHEKDGGKSDMSICYNNIIIIIMYVLLLIDSPFGKGLM